MEKDDKLLLANLQDKINKCIDYNMPTNTNFLDSRQGFLIESYCKKIKGLKYEMVGGYEEAERTLCVILPEYEIDYVPISLIRLIKKGPRELSHRDYLGSILGMGIKREQVGDIIVTLSGADIIVIKEMTEFLLNDFSKVGNTPIEIEVIDLNDISKPIENFEEIKLVVSSLRLDNVVAAMYKTSRSKAQEAIEKGHIYVNGTQIQKTEKNVKQGDKVVFRGKGKNILTSIIGNTNKDKSLILIQKYL